MTHPCLEEILAELKQYLEREYQGSLAKIVLFGSQARQDAETDSDIDVLVALDKSFSFIEEVKRTSDFITELCLERAVLVSLIFVSASRLETEQTPFFMNVRREGISL